MRGGFRKGMGLSPKKLNQMMKQMGISVEEMDDVEEVVIKTADAELVFAEPEVSVTDAQGSKVYQITGAESELEVSQEDVEIVMEKAGCSETEAKAALTETKGDLAEAISKLCVE
jgi:nascent polypeptide-associated complex subunit alpha